MTPRDVFTDFAVGMYVVWWLGGLEVPEQQITLFGPTERMTTAGGGEHHMSTLL